MVESITTSESSHAPTRSYTPLAPQWKRFQHPPTLSKLTPYNQQYSHIYTARLNELRPRILSSIDKSSKKSLLTNRIIELKEGEESIAIGTLVKSSSKDKDDDECTLVLEDESGRVELCQQNADAFPVSDRITGIVIAVRGTVRDNGVMTIEQTYIPSLPPLPDVPGNPSNEKILLLSGLKLGSPKSTLRHSLLIDFLAGYINSPSSAVDSLLPSRISRIFIAGNSIDSSSEPSHLIQLDMFLSELLASGIPTCLISGENDPTNANLPHQPFHSCLLPHATTYKNMLELSPNPFDAKLGKRLILGTDGCRISVDDDPLRALERSLRYSHICPDAPSVVGCFPFVDNDPFVIKDRPDVYFAGNCKEYSCDLVDGTRIVCIPSFEETGQVVVVDLGSLDCEAVKFDVSAIE